MDIQIIGYTASTITIVAFGLQFFHIIRCGTIKGVSLYRTAADSLSLLIWVFYATRIEDYPLLIASSCELFMSLCLGLLVMKHALCPPIEKQNMIMDTPYIIVFKTPSLKSHVLKI